MPEIPDLDVLKERLSILINDTITSVDVLFPVTFRVTVPGTPSILVNQRVHAIERRGKFLVFTLDTLYLVFKLMVTGKLHMAPNVKKTRHTVAIFRFASGIAVRFYDFKKMGKIFITDKLDTIPEYALLGIEPLSDQFTITRFSTLLSDKRPIKIVLTDQSLIAGIGNVYADEILFHAGLNPKRAAASLTDEEIAVLHNSIQFILKNAIIMVRTRLTDTSEKIRDFLLIHGKKGQLCPVCRSTIREIVIAQRVTHVCPQCQKVNLPW
jgi:formamidopyrimidine-DNA glycosylase